MPSGCIPAPQDMVAWYPFDEATGTTAVNLRGPSPLANLISGPAHVAGKVGNGLKFDGLNDRARSTTPDPNLGAGDFSIDFWMQTPMNQNQKTLHVLEKRTKAASSGVSKVRGYAVAIQQGKVLLQIGNGSTVGGGWTNYAAPASAVVDGKWHHVAITVQRTDPNGINFYVDGVPKDMADPRGRQGSLDNGALLTIGEDTFGFVSRFKGILDELEIFTRALTPAEVGAIHGAGSAGKCKLATIYVCNNFDHTVSPVQVGATTADAAIPTSGGKGGPENIAITPDGKWAYVVRSGFAGDVTPIDLSTNTSDTPISVIAPSGIAIAPDGKRAYVASAPNNLTPIDLLTNLPGTPISVGGAPHSIAITPDGTTAYVTAQSTQVFPITLPSGPVGAPITVGSGPKSIAITPDGKWAYVGNSNSASVSPIDLSSNIASPSIALGGTPVTVVISPDGAYAYVTHVGTSGGKVAVIDVQPGSQTFHAVVNSIAVGFDPEGIAITPDGTLAFVSISSTNKVVPITLSTGALMAPISVGSHPAGIAVTPS